MHFKQSFLQAPSRKANASQQQHSSLEESPIPTHFREDSDHSPQQYLYPESLKRNRNVRRVYDLKQRIVGLLQKLKEWLQELCLTDACVNEVGEQLQPIIDELREVSEQESADSYWFSLRYASDNRHSVLKDSSSLSKTLNQRNQSILIHESRERSEVWFMSEGEKNLVRIFFKKYCRLLENSLYRINRYSGQKKLKFLLETNIRSIFSQTLRISYDLKLIDFKFRQERKSRAVNNKYAYVNLTATRINMIFYHKGSVKNAFQTLKSVYYEESKRDSRIVENMVDKIQKLNKIYNKNALKQLQKFTFKWRQSTYKCKLEQQVFLIDCIRSKIYEVLNQLTELGENSSDFGTHWRYLIECALNSICTQLFGQQDCFFMNLQEIMNERSTKREKLITLADFLQEEDSDSRVDIDRSFLTQLTIEQLRACILSGQIHRNEKSQQNLLLIPIKPASGIFFVRLQTEMPSPPQMRVPMRLSSFRCLLRVVQLITPIIEDLASVCRRVEACWEQTEKNEHYSLLLKEFLKADLTNNEEGHLQLQCKSSEIQIDSHRLESSAETAKNIMEKCGIACLVIYHCKSQSINQVPCILYGNNEVVTSQRYIIQSIYDQLVNSGKDHLVVNRNGQIFNILPIWQKGVRVGLVNYVLFGEKVDNQVVSQCLVPLLLKCQGKIECQHCQVSLKIPEVNHEKSIEAVEDGVESINFESSIKLIRCQTLLQLQSECCNILRQKGNYFFKMVYKIDLSQMNIFYTINANKQIELIHLKDTDKLMHRQMFIEDYTSLTYCSPFAKLAYRAPCFNNPQLYIYQNENQYPLRFVAIPIKNGKEHYGYALSAFYHIDKKNSEDNMAFLSQMVEAFNLNQTIFKPSKLNDQRLEEYIREEQLKESKQIEQQIFKMITQPKKGKLTEQLLDLSTNIKIKINQINKNKYECSIKAFKLNLFTKKIRIILSTNNQSGETNVEDELIQKLNIQSILSTHERLTSSDCKLKEIDRNRRIKPIKTQNLNNINVFLPKLSVEANKQIYEIIKNKYELKGVIASQNLDFIQDLKRKLFKYALKENIMFSLMKIGHNQRYNQIYFVLFQHQIIDSQDKYVLNQCVIKRSYSIFRRIFQKSNFNQVSSSEKMKKIKQIYQLMPRKHKIRNAVLSFKNKLYLNENNITIFFSKLQKYISNNKSLNLVYFKYLRTGFERLKQLNQQKMKKGLILIQRISPRIHHIWQKQSKQIGFRAIYESNPSINHNRVCHKIDNVLLCKVTNYLKQSFSAIQGISKLRIFNRLTDHADSARKIHIIVSNIQKRENYDYFFSQINKIHQQFINSFNLIELQFQNIQFSSRQTFVIFANQRFETILRHIGYGLVDKVEIGVAQIYQKKLIIYRQDNQNQLLYTIAQKPVSLQPQNHNNFNFVPIKTRFSNNNFLIYKVSSKDNCKFDKEFSIIKKCIIDGIVPCFQRYLICQLDKADRFCSSILRITCKEMWNGSIDETQGIYAFGKGNNYQLQCDKIRALCMIKQIKRANLIKQLKMIRHAINQETKQYYRLEYEYNAINTAISCGIPIQIKKDDFELYQKYGEIIPKDKLREQRQATDKMEIEYEKKSLQYQIKSKTFATSKIIMLWDKKDKQDVQNTKISLIMNKQIQNQNKDNMNLEKAIVERKIKISENAQKMKNLDRKRHQQSARSIFLLFNRISKVNLQKSIKQAFITMAWPKVNRIRA